MEMPFLNSQLEYDVLCCHQTSYNSHSNHPSNPFSRLKEHIYLPNFIKNVTLFFPARDQESVKKFREDALEFEDSSCIISNITLLSLTNLEFINQYLVPKNLSLFNVHNAFSSKIEFLINSKGILYLLLDLDVFRSLGLANCKIIHRNGDESVTLEVNLTDPLYTNEGSKLYERLQKSLAKISPTSVIVSSENANSLDLVELKNMLEKTSKDFKLSPCFLKTSYSRVPLNTKHTSSKVLYEKLNYLKNDLNKKNQNEVNGKRRKTESNSSDLDSRFEKFMENKDTLLKVFNTLKKNTGKSGQVFKDMIHELNQKNVHSNFDIYNEESSELVPNVVKFVDLLNLNSVKEPEEYRDHRGFEFYDMIKLTNGLVSKELVLNLVKNSWDVLLKEAGFFILSLYTTDEKRLYTKSLVEAWPDSGSYSHIFCCKLKETDEVVVVTIKSN